MNVRYRIAATILLTCTIGSTKAWAFDRTSRRVLLDKEGGAIEVRVTHADDKQTRDAVRQQLQQEIRNGIPFTTPAMRERRKQIQYRYESTPRGGKIRIIAKSREALLAVQDFLRSQMSNSLQPAAVAFDYIANTSLVVVPVTVNNHGPYKFLLDTGASNTLLSTAVADSLGLPKGRSEMLFTAGGNVPVTVRTINLLQVGAARLEDVGIAVGNFGLMKTLNVDGILGGDYLRRFKVSIDYNNQLVDIEPCCPETMSQLVA